MPTVKNNSSIYSLFFYLLTAISLFGCGGGGGGSSSSSSDPVVTLDTLSLTNVSSTLKVAETFQLNVTGTYSDASTEDLSSEATWTVANSAVLEVSNTGLVTALSAGSTTVTASFGGLSIQRSISVKALADLSISPTSVTLAIASAQQLSVTGRYTDNSTEAFDNLVTWESSNLAVASVSNAGEVLAASAGTVSITASVGAISSSLSVTVLPDLDSLSVTVVSSSLKVAETFQLNVTGTYSDASTEDLSSEATWTVANSAVLEVSNTGLVTALSAGSTTVTASFGGLSIQRNISVKALADLSISPTSVTLAIASAQQLSVTGRYTDNSTEAFDNLVTWESSNLAVASVSNSGEVLAASAGTVSITASVGAISSSLSVTVLPNLDSLSVTVVSSSLKVAETFQLNVTGTYSDASTEDLSSEATWTVANSAVLEVSNTGLVTALSAGSTTVTASFGGLSIQRNISVKALADLSISPTSVTLAIASAQQLSVTGRYTDNSTEAFDNLVTWESSNLAVASVSNSGEVLAASAGTVSITASVGAISSSLSVTVSPATLQSIVVSSQSTQIASGLSSTFSAKGIYSDGTEQNLSDQVVWSVSDSSKASIDADTGLLTALQAGTTSVIAAKEDLSGSLLVTVSAATLSSIALTPSAISLAKGSSAEINVTAIFSDNSKQDVSDQVVWSNSNNLVASIEENSYTVLALVEGLTTLSASLSGLQADLSVTVTDAELVSLSLSPINASIPLGRSQQYSAQGTYTDGTVQDLTSQVTWLSSSESQALISNIQALKGLAETIAVGSTTITAVIGDIQQDTVLVIESAVLTSIEIQPASQTVAQGTDAQVKALGYYSDGSQIDLSSKVLWSTPNTTFIDVLSASNGLVHTLNQGSALISAELDGVSTLANITVSSATLESIEISTEQTNVPSGMTQRLVATGTYSDTSTKDLSQQVTWQSNDVELATVSNNNTESGLLRALSPGQLTVTASFGGVSDQIVIDVTNAVLTALQVNSGSAQLNVKSSILVTATASYSDASTKDVSSQVNWLSSDVNVASIGNGVSDKGLVKALSAGFTNISASLNGLSATPVQLEVTLNPNLPKALNLSVQPNIILNNDTDTAQINLTLVPSVEGGVIADGTAVTLTINEGGTSRIENLVTIDGAVSYSLQSSHDGFITLSASSSDFSVSSGLLSTDELSDAILARGQSSVVYESDTLKAGSVFYIFLRNISNRNFNIEQIDLVYLDPNNGNAIVGFPESPLTADQFISDGDLIAGEFTYVGYELDFDIEASVYVVSYLFSDDQSNTFFRLEGSFDFSQ